MKVSEMIERLQHYKSVFGDDDVRMVNSDEGMLVELGEVSARFEQVRYDFELEKMLFTRVCNIEIDYIHGG